MAKLQLVCSGPHLQGTFEVGIAKQLLKSLLPEELRLRLRQRHRMVKCETVKQQHREQLRTLRT